MRNHFNSLNGQLADLRKENSLLRTEIQKLTDKLSQKELLQNKSQDLPLSNVLSYADTIKRCASVVVMPKESSQAVSKIKSDIIVRNSESVIDTIVIVCDEKTSCYEFYIFVHVKLICTSVNKAIY
jgi:regulator of replication initiation timing